MSRERGFSVLEMIVAMSLMLAVTAGVFALVDPMHGTLAAQSEVVDMQQRLRVAADALYRDLIMAGSGAYQDAKAGPLAWYFAPVLPYRQGSTVGNPPGTFKTDAITVMYVPSTAAQTTLSTTGPSTGVGDVSVNIGAGCPSGDVLCGFKNGMDVLLYDDNGTYDAFTVTNAQTTVLTLKNNNGRLTYTGYQPNTTKIVQFSNAVYFLKTDPATATYQLMYHDGGAGSDVPVLDHLVALTFEYLGDPDPPTLTGNPLTNPVGPWTTYGPAPPVLGQQIPSAGYPPGENCTFTIDPASGLQVPRLPVLPGSGSGTLVPLTAAQLDGSDGGPWCPDPVSPNRWDADLLRIRTIGVTIRVEAANAALRGPASALFTHGGTSTGSRRWLPDHEMRFQVTPRNLNLAR